MIKLFWYVLTILVSFNVVADDIVIPSSFYYNKLPIEPFCFNFGQDSSRFDPKKISDCSDVADKITIIKDEREGNDDGFMGYSYKLKDSQDITESYIYYKYLGEIGNVTIVWGKESGGGSGDFSEIIHFTRDNDTITKTMDGPGGDRCNGGIVDASVDGDALSYSQNITPIDFLEIAGDNPKFLKAYEHLAACAVCCAGVAEYKGIDLVSIKLSDNNLTVLQGKYQDCFNGIYNDYISQNKTNFKKDELKNFTNRFNKECVK